MPSMFPSSGATIRADINQVVVEASSADDFFIGEMVLPPLSVAAKSGTYPKLQIAEAALLDAISTDRERGGSYGQVSRKWTTDTYDCIDRGLEEPVDDTDQSDLSRFFNAESTAAMLTLRNIKLAQEVRVQAVIQNTGNFAATNSGVAYTTALASTNSFIADVLAATERVADNGQHANTVVMSQAVFHRIATSSNVQAFVRGSINGNVQMPMNAANLATALADYGIERVLIGRARQNTAKKGQAKSVSPIWNNTYVWVGRVNPAALTPQSGGAGFIFYWNLEGGLYVSETYRDESRRSNIVRVRQNTTEKVSDATCGTLITTQYS